MKSEKKSKIGFYVGIFVFALAAAFFLDLIVKRLVAESLVEDIILIPDFLKITFQQNTGIAFSIGLPYIVQLLLFPILISLGAYVVLSSFNTKSPFVLIVSGMIVGGALGNFLDRIIYHHVIDYISIWKYPVFNLADVWITLGIFLLIVFYGKIKRTN